MTNYPWDNEDLLRIAEEAERMRHQLEPFDSLRETLRAMEEVQPFSQILAELSGAMSGPARTYMSTIDRALDELTNSDAIKEFNAEVLQRRTMEDGLHRQLLETRLSLENAISELPAFDYLRRQGSGLEELAERISFAIREASFAGEFSVEAWEGEEDVEADEETEESGVSATEVEERLVEVVSANVLGRLKAVNFEPITLLDRVLRSPNAMYDMQPREFEQFVASLVEHIGFEDVLLTPRSGDQGRDVLAIKRVHGIQILVAIECKQYASHRPVGVGILRALLGTISHADTKASMGVLVTTSRFTSGATRFIVTEPQLDGKDFDGICGWLGEYAKRNNPDC